MIWTSVWLLSLRRQRMKPNLYQSSADIERTKSNRRYSKMSSSKIQTGAKNLLEIYLPNCDFASARSTSGIGIKGKRRDFLSLITLRKNEQDLNHFYQEINEESVHQNDLRLMSEIEVPVPFQVTAFLETWYILITYLKLLKIIYKYIFSMITWPSQKQKKSVNLEIFIFLLVIFGF